MRHSGFCLKRDLAIVIMTVLQYLILFYPGAASADVAVWQIVSDKSSLVFTATQNGAPVSGSFKTFKGDIEFSLSDLEHSRVNIVVDTGSVSASYSDLVDALKTPDWFNVKVFPQAVFKADRFKKTGEKTYQADGTLTIRNITKPVVITFSVEEAGDTKARIRGGTTIQRNDFGVGQGDWAGTDEIKNDVRIDFVLSVVRK
ncbi:Protein YceI [Aquicella siphonis]|uniref:Protein YceI n=1 Tax=Aquicella siphonis TaxID=254247 RepID=A0A5E4PF81_9COXI|nr:YceI family protein [Aquicella siphonis]VVC75639.1 Protein YceI [Aquicella siphonis]